MTNIDFKRTALICSPHIVNKIIIEGCTCMPHLQNYLMNFGTGGLN
jgi:hypothetical protein